MERTGEKLECWFFCIQHLAVLRFYSLLIISNISSEHGIQAVENGWFMEGNTLGVAVDFDTGCMFVSCGREGGQQNKWTSVLSSVIQPSLEAGAALVPCVLGTGGARLQCNFGLDPRNPLKYLPPSKEFTAASEGMQVII